MLMLFGEIFKVDRKLKPLLKPLNASETIYKVAAAEVHNGRYRCSYSGMTFPVEKI